MTNQHSRDAISPAREIYNQMSVDRSKYGSALGQHHSLQNLPEVGGIKGQSLRATPSEAMVYSSAGKHRHNQSLDYGSASRDGDTFKKTASSMLARMAANKGHMSAQTIDYGFKEKGRSISVRKDPYMNVEISDMFKREAKAQYEGTVPRYKLPDTGPHQYRIYGQTQWKLSKTKKTTIIGEIFDKAKTEKGKMPGPSSYN